MVHRLQEVVGEGMCDWQFGFRPGRSVEDAWLHVRRCVNGSVSKYVLGVFVDFKGAFDYLDWACVLRKLREVGCREMGLCGVIFLGEGRVLLVRVILYGWMWFVAVHRGLYVGRMFGI